MKNLNILTKKAGFPAFLSSKIHKDYFTSIIFFVLTKSPAVSL